MRFFYQNLFDSLTNSSACYCFVQMSTACARMKGDTFWRGSSTTCNIQQLEKSSQYFGLHLNFLNCIQFFLPLHDTEELFFHGTILCGYGLVNLESARSPRCFKYYVQTETHLC